MDSSKQSRPSADQGPKVVHWPIASSDLDADAVKIVRRLTRFDHRAYFVGGCVRDLLLERKPKDFDVATSATPRQMKRLFRNCRIIGRRFRLAHIYFQNGKIIEVATFRAMEGQDNPDAEPDREDLLIRDDNVFGTPAEDALRRDFTINSLFYDLNDQNVLDHADGLTDLRSKLVRTIGDPDIRFREDPIRILRAIKFAARLGFTIEPRTLESIRRNRTELDKAAPPRVLEEINRFCRGGAARRSFELLGETGMFEVVFQEIGAGYSQDPAAWDLMLALLECMDAARPAGRGDVRTGEIFAAILLPVLARQVGWKQDGTVARPGGLNLRGLIDKILRPMALRLRAPRREQEHCRQILGTLFRMVPARRLRRGVKGAILNRDCLPDALWILEKIAERLGGDFSDAHRFWTERYKPEESRDEESPEATKPAGARGRRRRPRRKTSAGREPASPPPEKNEPSGEEEESDPADHQPPWHDHSFFAALPSAPEVAGDDTKGDRYGTAAVPTSAESSPAESSPTESSPTESSPTESSPAESSPAESSPTESSDESPAEEPTRRPRRRRRRRRRRAGSADSPGGAENPDAAQTSENSGEEEGP